MNGETAAACCDVTPIALQWHAAMATRRIPLTRGGAWLSVRWRGLARWSGSPGALYGLDADRLAQPGRLPVACRSRRASAGLNPENPDRNNRPEHG
jgi:hypothetical protein